MQRGRSGERAFTSDDPDLIDLLAAFTARPATVAKGHPPAWLAEIMLELREAWHPGLSVARVAQRAGVHPVYLARSVRRWYGTGVGEELRRLRIRAAAAAVAETPRTVCRVAHSCGFSDEPHLCRDFRRAVGITPGRYRMLMKELGYHWRGRL